ncbi:metallophosphoesterase family protein [candidate division WOR-3 bacterium]|nr:metallophosphoesterase family protein [candidate division WOR-3 bacterium]
MKIAVLSDVHSNIDALEAVVQDAKSWKAELFLVAGDIVGYGACPDQCIDLLKKLEAGCIAGNHDWGVIEKTPIDYFNSAARKAILWTREKMTDTSRAYLEALPLTMQEAEISLAHGDFLSPESWAYVFTLPKAAEEFSGFNTAIGIIGHSHVPFIIRAVDKESWPEEIKESTVTFQPTERYLVNVGSVGQPRDYDPRACYLRIDSDIKQLSLERVEYDIKAAQRRILDAGLPSSLAARLSVGQ